MKLAVGLLTCGREDYTARTLASWLQHNDQLRGAELLHADDGSVEPTNLQGAWLAGFETISEGERVGQLVQLRRLVAAAIQRGCDTFMLLENDWETVRPLADIPAWPDGVDCIRLYGEWKDRERRRAAGQHVIGTHNRVEWSAFGDDWQFGVIHWGGPPSLVRLELLELALRSAVSFKGISLASTGWKTLRPRANFVFHIGEETTPGFVP